MEVHLLYKLDLTATSKLELLLLESGVEDHHRHLPELAATVNGSIKFVITTTKVKLFTCYKNVNFKYFMFIFANCFLSSQK